MLTESTNGSKYDIHRRTCDYPSVVWLSFNAFIARGGQFSEVTPQDLQFLFEMGVQCELDTVRANAVRIVSIIGCCLAVPVTPHPLLKVSVCCFCYLYNMFCYSYTLRFGLYFWQRCTASHATALTLKVEHSWTIAAVCRHICLTLTSMA